MPLLRLCLIMRVRDGEEVRKLAASIIERGGVIAFRTDTFYGLGADPFNRAALRKIFELKGREARKPILVVISDENFLERLITNRSSLFDGVIRKHWPGALTIIASARDEVPDELTAGTGTLGMRLPDDSDVREFVRACGGILTATSANPSMMPTARNALEVESYFDDRIDLIVDAGEARSEQPSSVLDLSGDEPRLIREGVVRREMLRETLEKLGSTLK